MATADLRFRIDGDASGFDNALGGARGALTKLQDTARIAMTAVGAAMAAAATKGVVEFAQFEKGMNEVFTLLPGITQGAMDSMTDQVKQLALDMGVLPDEVVPALYQAISAGVPQENVFEFLETAVKTSIGGVTDLDTAVDGITTVTNAWGAETVTATQAADIMFTTMRLGKTTIGEVSDSLFQVAPVAAAAGIAFEDIGAALSVMVSTGTPTRVAATQLRTALVELGKSGSVAFEAFRDATGKTFPEFIAAGGTLNEAFDIMGRHADDMGTTTQNLFGSVEGGMAATALSSQQGSAAFGKAMTEMQNSAGAAEAAFGQMDQGLSRVWDRVKAAVSVALIEIGKALAPFLEDLADWMVKRLPDAIETTRKVMETLSSFIGDRVIPFVQDFIEGVRILWDWMQNSLPGGIKTVAIALGALLLAVSPVTAAVVGLTAAVAFFGSGAREDKEDVKEFTQALLTMGDTADDVAFIMQEFNERNEDIVPNMARLGVSVDDVRGALSLSKEELDKWIDSVTEQRRAAGMSRDELEGFHSTVRELWKEHQLASDEADRLRFEMEKEAEAAELGEKAMRSHAQGVNAAHQAQADIVIALDDTNTAMAEAVEPVEFLGTTYINLKTTAAEAMTSINEEAKKHTETMIDIFGEAVPELELTAGEMFEAVRSQIDQKERFEATLRALTDAGLFGLADQLARSGPKATGAMQALLLDMDKAFELEQMLGETAANGVERIKQKLTSTNTKTKLNAAGAQMAAWIAQTLQVNLEVGGSNQTGFSVSSEVGPPNVALQHGTPYWRGGVALVGEAGPELVELPQGSRVHSNADSRAIAADLMGGPGGGDIHLHIAGHVVTEHELVEFIARALRQREFARGPRL